MDEEANALQRAAAQVWLFGDGETVAFANAVVIAAVDVVSAHHQPSAGWTRNFARIAVTGKHAKDVERIDAARSSLANARKALINHTRATLGLDETDPFALAIIA